MVEGSDLILASIPLLALAGPVLVAGARLLESLVGVGSTIAALPLTSAGLVASLLVIVGATVVSPPSGVTDS